MQFRKTLRVAVPTLIILAFISPLFLKPDSGKASEGDETVYYLLTDHLGSVDVVLDEDGNVVERRDYLPYGSERMAQKTLPPRRRTRPLPARNSTMKPDSSIMGPDIMIL